MIEFQEEIGRASRHVARDWPGVIEEDDIRQEIWIRLIESPKAQNALRGADSALRFDLLKRWATQIASSYANDYELFSGNAFYGTDHVRNLLKSGLLVVMRRDLGDMKETLTEFLDLHDAFGYLKKTSEYAQVIWNAYIEGKTPENGAQERRVQRAVTALTDAMNQAHKRRFATYTEGPGTRRVLSNEQARNVSKSDLNDDKKNNSFNQ